MGWNSSFIVVNSDIEVDQLELLKSLGFTELQEDDDEPLKLPLILMKTKFTLETTRIT